MFDNKDETITTAKPHTIKKFEIIANYVDAWARKILNFKESSGIVYIDCMSNSGMYVDENGNQVEGTALRVAKILDRIVDKHSDKKAYVYFNDLNQNRILALKENIESLKLESPNLIIKYSISDANDYLKNMNLELWKQHNVLLIYDPYQASIDWDAIHPFFNDTWGEVIINHMVSDTKRGAIQVTDAIKIKKYEDTYHRKINELIQLGSNLAKLDEIVKDIIHENNRKKEKKLYISSFPFYNRKNGVVYNLIFCTRHIEGIKLYKRTTWKAFGNKSSNKATNNIENQLCFLGQDCCNFDTITDEGCFFIKDIAKYVYDTFSNKGRVPLDEVWRRLDEHPIFPCEGFKNDIKAELKNTYSVEIINKQMIFK